MHAGCTVVKLHGDYEDVRILNTPDELREYPPALDAYLDRVFDEFGAIVAGWSAEWDGALRGAILRSPTRRYSWYWLARGEPAGAARVVIEHRDASVIAAGSADAFFPQLAERVAALERTGGPHPLSPETAVATTKHLLSEERFGIRLRDLVADETAVVLGDEVPTSLTTQERLEYRLARTATLRAVLSTLAFHGGGPEVPVLLRVALERIARLGAPTAMRHATEETPAVLAVYSAGIAAVGAKRYDNLRAILIEPEVMMRPDRQPERLIWLTRPGAIDDFVGQVPGYERDYTAASRWLSEVLKPDGRRFLLADEEYEAAFDVFELLATLVHVDRVERTYDPLGRLGWRPASAPAAVRFINEGRMAGSDWPVLTELFDGDRERLLGALGKIDETLQRRVAVYLRWEGANVTLAGLYTRGDQ